MDWIHVAEHRRKLAGFCEHGDGTIIEWTCLTSCLSAFQEVLCSMELVTQSYLNLNPELNEETLVMLKKRQTIHERVDISCL
jgi:hypothetical protein